MIVLCFNAVHPEEKELFINGLRRSSRHGKNTADCATDISVTRDRAEVYEQTQDRLKAAIITSKRAETV